MSDEIEYREVVRLSRSSWHDKTGIHQRINLVRLAKKSTGNELLREDAGMAGADQVFPRILNLNKCEDGIYVVTICNAHKDWETGHVEDWDYELTPFLP